MKKFIFVILVIFITLSNISCNIRQKGAMQFPRKTEVGILMLSTSDYMNHIPFVVFFPAKVDTTKPIIESFKTKNLSLGVMCGYYMGNEPARKLFIKKYATKIKLDKPDGNNYLIYIAPVIIESIERDRPKDIKKIQNQKQSGNFYLNGDSVNIRYIFKSYEEFNIEPYMPKEK